MRWIEVKERFITDSEKNGENDGIASDDKRISLLFNRSQNKLLTLGLQNRKSDDVRYIQNFLVLDKSIPTTSTTQDKVNFILPKNYFDLADARATAKKGNYEDLIYLFELRTENLSEILQDEFNKPSFEWREAPYTVNSNSFSIYTNNEFTITELLLNYYRYPNQMKLLQEEDAESGFDESLEMEWDDKSLDDIISLMVFNNDINESNPRYQLQTMKIQK